MLYDKNLYDNYPSYLMGKIKGKNKNNAIEYTAPSPNPTAGNKHKYGKESWRHIVDVATGEAKEYTSKRRKKKLHQFGGYGGSILPLADYGIRTAFVVEGNARKRKNNTLDVFVAAKGDPSNNLSGFVTVTQDEKLFSKKKLKKSPYGYYYRTGGPKPLGNANISLPDSGKYDVEVNVVGDIYETGSHFPTSYRKKLPIYEE